MFLFVNLENLNDNRMLLCEAILILRNVFYKVTIGVQQNEPNSCLESYAWIVPITCLYIGTFPIALK